MEKTFVLLKEDQYRVSDEATVEYVCICDIL